MNIQILHLIEGAKKASGVTVIIDVSRAFTVEAYLANNNAEKIIPVGDINFAYNYKKEHPQAVLIGERGGKICEGFDYGNSPSQIKDIDFSGKTIIHTTSAGTQGIANAKNADVILTGSLVNAKAVARYIKQLNPENVSLVCMGLEAKAETEEDTLCAEYIKSILEGNGFDLEKGVESLKYTSGAKFFDEQNDIFPEEDFHLSTKADIFNFVLRVEKDENGLNYVKKIEV
ncbi:MAG: 2-phosphosulfolactate phosphatase [Clostridia bacterium]|nr:2-phosphosulfolactate phosphatase [Clostridia bacterium]